MEQQFDSQCLEAIKSAVLGSISQEGWPIRDPVQKALGAAIGRNAGTIENQFDSALKEILTDGEFVGAVKDQIRKQMARSIVSGMQGSVDKVVNKLKADPVRHAMMIQAVNGVLEKFEHPTQPVGE